MNYITHTKYKGKGMNGDEVLITRGKNLIRNGNVLFFDGKPVCIYRSEVAKRHFSINDDKQGLVRGDLTYKIAYSDSRTNVNGWIQRFNEKQKELLCSDRWNKFLNLEHDVIIFNDSFFEADVSELQTLCKEMESCNV